MAGKRFLLVLDDVWNEKQKEWEAVQTPLNYGAPGSTILVTTRSDKVASTMRSCKVLHLKPLEEDNCWRLFANHAFQHGHLQLNAELKGIATKIVERCKGLPLALKSIGSLLCSKSSVSEWENVLKSKLWDLPTGDNEILPALLLSYHHLPSHLKRCFSYCALFSKDYEFNKKHLIQLWMAQNFLKGHQQSKSPEEVGEQYFDDLLSKYFFQPCKYRYERRFVMHDLVNDLANYVSGDISIRLEVGKARRVPKTSRHFSIASNYEEYFDVFESLHDAKRLRTFFPREILEPVPWECKMSIHELFSKFKFLHVLSLCNCSDLIEVPDSLGELKHLRSLDLSWTLIEKLPDSTCLLYNLQILKVGCGRLEELPVKLYKLTNLRCLEFKHTRVRRMPMHFGKLKNLQVLDVFYAGKSSEFSIRQLGAHNLYGKLSTQELQNVEDPSDALAVDLINKTGLVKVDFEWNREHIPLDDPRKEKEVLENLQPSKNLKYLSICKYGGTQFPSWLSNNSLANMVSLYMKKFLLVLDDVWNEGQEEWEAVQTPLGYGAPGSRILVTTRNESVARIMRSNEMHYLQQLRGDQSWKVFAKHAFQDDHPQLNSLNSEIKEISTKIVEKCKGLPLALKSIGCLLHTKSVTVTEWENVLLSNIWELKNCKIMPALILSYCHLPSYLKRCFAFCAVFPKDFEFDKDELILLWIAEGFLQCPQQSQSPLEVGEIYFDDLLSRSFFQQSGRSERYFYMHDLVNDLAKYVCGDICFRYGVDTAKSLLKTTRHFSFANADPKYWDGSGSITDAKRLRTFIPTTTWITGDLLIPVNELFSKFKYLRVLSLCGYLEFEELPESVSELKYLCSLDLSYTKIKRLPDSTCLLYNLQVLKLNSCESLEVLPSNLHKLINLRCLEFRNTGVREMPVPLEALKNLQVLSPFCVGKSSESSIQQLGGFNLHGKLSIKELQNIVNPMDALAVDLKSKTHLLKLELEWNREHILLDDPTKEKEVLENLQPSKLLKDLSIENYGGTQFPSWLTNNSLSNVVFLRLKDCKYCVCLPSLGLLPSLKELTITRFDGIVSIGAEFYGSSSSPFPSLDKLYFEDMKEWEEWEWNVTFPRLQHLSIKRCPKLKGLSEQLLNIKELSISDCVRVTISGPSLEALSLETIGHAASNTCLEELHIYDCSNINIPMRLCYDLLQELVIHGSCDSLTTFSLDFFPELCSLELSNCRNLQMILQERTHTHLKELAIEKCHQFESLPKHMHILLPSLADLCIRDCPKVEMFAEGGLPSNLKSVHLSSYKLIGSLKGSLGVNTCLKGLWIQGMDEVECFPEEGFLPISLTSLIIWKCRNLKRVDYKGLCQLSSLEELWLWKCPNLEYLPQGLPKSISTLEICYCPVLKQPCQRPEGQD